MENVVEYQKLLPYQFEQRISECPVPFVHRAPLPVDLREYGNKRCGQHDHKHMAPQGTAPELGWLFRIGGGMRRGHFSSRPSSKFAT